MNISRQMFVSILFASIVLLTGVLFWPFIFNEIITPIALTAWLFLRIFVLSIDQIYYWAALIFIAVILIFRLLPRDPSTFPVDNSLDENETIENIGYWRNLFTLADINSYEERAIKRELLRLVLSLYASKQRASPNFMFYDALKRGDVFLPDHIHAFLFPDKPQEKLRFPQRLVRFFRETPRKWIRRWSGQEIADYYRTINEILCFVETSLEIENDAGKFLPNEN